MAPFSFLSKVLGKHPKSSLNAFPFDFDNRSIEILIFAKLPRQATFQWNDEGYECRWREESSPPRDQHVPSGLCDLPPASVLSSRHQMHPTMTAKPNSGVASKVCDKSQWDKQKKTSKLPKAEKETDGLLEKKHVFPLTLYSFHGKGTLAPGFSQCYSANLLLPGSPRRRKPWPVEGANVLGECGLQKV